MGIFYYICYLSVTEFGFPLYPLFYICWYLLYMKFIITEEQNEKLNQKVKSMVNKLGLDDTIKLFDGSFDVIKRAYQSNPSDYLNQFNDLILVETGNKIFYVDKDRLPLFYYYPNEENSYVYINYNRIWVFFSKVIGLKRSEIQEIIKNWLEETYNLKGLTPSIVRPLKMG